MMSSDGARRPDLNKVSLLRDDDPAWPNDLKQALSNAREFLNFYEWVYRIESQYLGVGIEGIIYIFLFKIETRRSDVEKWVWVFEGDIPPAYFPGSSASNPFEALDAYIGAMEEWIIAARASQSVSELIPVNLPASKISADRLEKKIKFLDENILQSLK
jgi:hypothetical protein